MGEKHCLKPLLGVDPNEFYFFSDQIKHKLIELNETIFGHGSMSNERIWAENVFFSNVINKSCHKSGMIVPGAVSMFQEKTTPKYADQIKHAHVLGWIVEIINAWFDIADQIVNRADLRNTSITSNLTSGNAWYQNPGVGLNAINDCFMLQAMAYNSVYLFVTPKHPCLADELSDAMRETYRARFSGVGFEESLKRKISLSETYTMENYRQLVRYKYCVPLFVAPMQYALIIVGKHENPHFVKQVKRIMLDIGYLVKLRAEWNEIFNNSENSDKPLTKMSWFTVKATEVMNSTGDFKGIENIRSYLVNKDTERLQHVFSTLGLKESYVKQEEIWQSQILQQAEDLKFIIKPEFFQTMLQTF